MFKNSLHVALENGDLASARSLFRSEIPYYGRSGKRMSAEQDDDGNTPLHLAMMLGQWQIAEELLDYGRSRAIK